MTALQYPGSIVTGQLTSTIASSGTASFNVSGWPTSIGDGSGRPWVIEVGPGLGNDEKILITSWAAGTATPSSSPLGRGWDGTSPIAHSIGELVKLVPDATSIQDFSDHVYKTTRDDHGQYARTDGTRAITGVQTFSAGLSVATGNLTVATGTAALQAVTATSVTASGALSAALSGTAGRYAGATNGAPVSGTYNTGDVLSDPTNLEWWVCTSGGTPGTWSRLGVVARAPISSQSVVVSQTAMAFGSATFDTAGGFGASNYTCKIAGFYVVSLQVALGSIPGGNGPTLVLTKNGTTYSQTEWLNTAASAQTGMALEVTDRIQLAANDTVGLTIGNATSGNAGGTQGGSQSYLSIAREM